MFGIIHHVYYSPTQSTNWLFIALCDLDCLFAFLRILSWLEWYNNSKQYRHSTEEDSKCGGDSGRRKRQRVTSCRRPVESKRARSSAENTAPVLLQSLLSSFMLGHSSASLVVGGSFWVSPSVPIFTFNVAYNPI